MTSQDAFTVNDYTVAIICALDKELRAVRCLLDSVHPQLAVSNRDTNDYTLGTIGAHNVVATCLPATEYGTNAAASVATQLHISFPMIEFALLVGIAGGVPSEVDIRLGDVVVGLPTEGRPGVMQYDFGKEMANGCFVETGTLQRPPRVLLSAITGLRSDPDFANNPLEVYLETIAQKDHSYRFPGRERDVLFRPDRQNDGPQQVQRAARTHEVPHIHYGLIASGNRVVKNALFRDRLAKAHNILCFEMEAAGILNIIPCLVIRGICDYSDCHKHKLWQEYAAAAAASYAKRLLCRVRAYQMPCMNVTGVYYERPYQPSQPSLSLPINTADPSCMAIDQHIEPDAASSYIHYPAAATQASMTGKTSEDIFYRAQSYASRSRLWAPIPADAAPLMTALKAWTESSGPDTLIVEPEGWRAAGRAETFAFEAIRFLRHHAQPTIWALWPEYEEPLTTQDIVHCLAEQTQRISVQDNLAILVAESPSRYNLLRITEHMDRCFLVVQVKDRSLATSLLETLSIAFRRRNRIIKLLLISYWPGVSAMGRGLPRAKVQRLSAPLPTHKVKRSNRQWWGTIQPCL